MADKKYQNETSETKLSEPATIYNKPSSKNVKGFVFESEDERLLKDADMPPLQKLMSFTKMIRRNAMLKKFE